MYTSIPTNIPDPFQIQYPGLGAAQVPVARSGHMSHSQAIYVTSTTPIPLSASQLIRPVVLINSYAGASALMPTVTDLVNTFGVSNTANTDSYVIPVYRLIGDTQAFTFTGNSSYGGSGSVTIPAYSAGVPECLVLTFTYNPTNLTWSYVVQ
jgi:hypothetical protein